jgi:hypothetical protein
VTAIVLSGQSPWPLSTMTRLVAAEAVVAVWLGTCWVGVSTTVAWSTQLTWVAGAIAGLVVGGFAATGWLMAGFRSVRDRQHALLAGVTACDRAVGTVPPDTPSTTDLVSGVGMTRFHCADCLLVDGKTVTVATRAQHGAAGRVPCGVCRP